jgi:SsrA-binding protein
VTVVELRAVARKEKRSDKPDEVKILIRNRRAFHDYDITDRLEAGLSLVGSEVKSLRDQRASIGEGFIEIRDRQAWLVGVTINEYPWANQFNHDPLRRRRLLLHKREIAKLDVKVAQKGYTLVPLAIYLKAGRIKLELGVARGKRQYEKREATKAAEAKREVDRAMKR